MCALLSLNYLPDLTSSILWCLAIYSNSCQNDLGTLVSSDLTWDMHYSHIILAKVNRTPGLLKRSSTKKKYVYFSCPSPIYTVLKSGGHTKSRTISWLRCATKFFVWWIQLNNTIQTQSYATHVLNDIMFFLSFSPHQQRYSIVQIILIKTFKAQDHQAGYLLPTIEAVQMPLGICTSKSLECFT